MFTRAGRSRRKKDLIGYAKQKLPSYMVPSAFVFVESLPLTPNGKIDRRALPTPVGGSPIDNGVSPGDRLEFELIRLWRKFLRVNNVGLSDNFFELGGDSLRAVSLVAEVERNLARNPADRFLSVRPGRRRRCCAMGDSRGFPFFASSSRVKTSFFWLARRHQFFVPVIYAKTSVVCFYHQGQTQQSPIHHTDL